MNINAEQKCHEWISTPKENVKKRLFKLNILCEYVIVGFI